MLLRRNVALAALLSVACAPELTTDERASTEPPGQYARVALLDPEAQSDARRGCDVIRMVERPRAAGETEVESRLRTLFAIDQVHANGLYNFIARTRSTLHLLDVKLTGTTAEVYLSGEITNLAGICDHPRARIQIEETALSAPGVTRVEIFLNGRPSSLQPQNGQPE